MWDFLFRELIYRPQLNIIQYLFGLTKDVGYSLMVMAIVYNIVSLYWIIRSNVNMQKTSILGQETKNITHYSKERNKLIQAKLVELNKDPQKNQEEIARLKKASIQGGLDVKKIRDTINKKFKNTGNYVLKTTFLQMWFSFGVFTIFNNITRGQSLEGLYPELWNGQTLANFGDNVKKFNNIDITMDVIFTGLLWVPVLNALFTFFAIYYSTKHAIRMPSRPPTNFEQKQMEKIKLQNEEDGMPTMDPEELAKRSQNINLFIIPMTTIIFNYNLSTGLNIYYAFLSILFFARTYIADIYFKNVHHQNLTDISKLGPIFPYEKSLSELYNGNFDIDFNDLELNKKNS